MAMVLALYLGAACAFVTPHAFTGRGRLAQVVEPRATATVAVTGGRRSSRLFMAVIDVRPLLVWLKSQLLRVWQDCCCSSAVDMT